MCLNPKIKIVSETKIINSKASEEYVSVTFDYTTSKWEGYVPIVYRRTGIDINFNNKEELYLYLNKVYEDMSPSKFDSWKKEQDKFWKTKPGATTTKSFFDKLVEGGWKCSACEMPRNPNPQRRIQDLKEFGYTIATDLSRYCPHCSCNTSQRLLLPIPRGESNGNGYENLSPSLRKRIIRILGGIDVYENVSSQHCLPDHKFSEIRWDKETKTENPDNMSENEIRQKFQLMTNQRNQQKREVCRTCFHTGKRGTIYGIPYYYEGGPDWDKNIPKNGKEAEKGCIGCPWYDIQAWRGHLILDLKKKKQP